MRIKRDYRDAVIGATVVLVGTLGLGLAYTKESSAPPTGYFLTARFTKADGINVGSQVRMSGMPVGKVVDQRLDDRFRAVATMVIDNAVLLTDDTAAVIQTDGLLGAKYIEMKPGGSETMLKPGEEVTYTQDAIVIEDLLDMIIQQARAKRGYLDKPLPGVTN